MREVAVGLGLFGVQRGTTSAEGTQSGFNAFSKDVRTHASLRRPRYFGWCTACTSKESETPGALAKTRAHMETRFHGMSCSCHQDRLKMLEKKRQAGEAQWLRSL